jgi:hypothetical protein
MNAEERRRAAEAFGQSELDKDPVRDLITPRWAVLKYGADEVCAEPITEPTACDDDFTILSEEEAAQLYDERGEYIWLGEGKDEAPSVMETQDRMEKQVSTASTQQSKIPEPRIKPKTKTYAMRGNSVGYVYVASNVHLHTDEGLPLLKIGMSNSDDPYDRLKSLSNSSTPSAFTFELFYKTRGAESFERALHSELRDFRYAPNKEFFCASLDHIKDTAESLFRRNLWRCDGVYYGPNLIPTSLQPKKGS